MDSQLVQRFRLARRDSGVTVLEGFHALKHAIRFGAEVEVAVAPDPGALGELAAALAPDVAAAMGEMVVAVDGEAFAELVPQPPRTGVVAIARRPFVDPAAALDATGPEPAILLEEPRNMGNLGACVRVAAAADAAAVLVTGQNDPWHPDAVRGAAGLHYALPVAALSADPADNGIEALGDRGDRPLIALDPEGEPLSPGGLPPRALLAFGTERHGLSDALLQRADARLSIPMREGVSSLNLATSVAAVLFAARLG